MKNSDIMSWCGLSKATLHVYLKAYAEGGLERLTAKRGYQPQSELHPHREKLAAYFREHPPAILGAPRTEAAAKIKELTGIERKPTQVGVFLKSLGMKPLKVGMIPAKADAVVQEGLKKTSGAPLSTTVVFNL